TLNLSGQIALDKPFSQTIVRIVICRSVAIMSLAVVNPRTGEADYSIEPLDGAAIAVLAGRLRAAQPDWAARSPEARGEALRGLAEAIGRHRAALIAALVADTGRAAISAVEVDAMIRTLHRWADS